MKIYLAGRYGRRDELREVRTKLQALGNEVTSSWLDTDWKVTGGGSSVAPPEERQKMALKDVEDIFAADCCISFTEDPDSTSGRRGGRHIEMGMAYQAGKISIIVGHRENAFHHLPSIVFYQTTEEMLKAIDMLGKFADMLLKPENKQWAMSIIEHSKNWSKE